MWARGALLGAAAHPGGLDDPRDGWVGIKRATTTCCLPFYGNLHGLVSCWFVVEMLASERYEEVLQSFGAMDLLGLPCVGSAHSGNPRGSFEHQSINVVGVYVGKGRITRCRSPSRRTG